MKYVPRLFSLYLMEEDIKKLLAIAVTEENNPYKEK